MMRSHRNSPAKTSRKNLLIVLCFLLIGVYLLRHRLFLLGINVALRITFPEGASHYDSLEWKEGRAVITGLAVHKDTYHLVVDQVEIKPSFSLRSLYFQQHLIVSHPQLTLTKTESKSSASLPFAALIPSRHMGMKWDIQNGILQLPDQRLFFKFQSGSARESIGAFSLSYDPHLFSIPIAFADLQMEEQRLSLELKIQQLELERLMQLSAFFYPQAKEGWEHLQGEIDLTARVLFDLPFEFNQITGSLDMHHLSAANAQLGIEAQIADFQGEFTYPLYSDNQGPIWKRVLASLSLRDGQFFSSAEGNDWGVAHVDADILLDPNTDPSVQLSGFLVSQGKESVFTLDGKGSVDEDRSFWLELAMKVQHEMEAFVSFCSSEKNHYVVQVDFEKLSQDQLHMFQKACCFAYPVLDQLQISQADIQGKMTGWIEHGAMKRLEVENLLAKDLELTWKDSGIQSKIAEAHVQGHLDGWRLSHINAYFKHADIGKCTDLSIDIELKDHHLRFSRAAGNFAGTAGILTLGREAGTHEMTGKLELKETPGEERALHFGMVWPDLFSTDFKTGWVRCEKLSEALYRPLFSALLPESTIDGDWDLFGTFDPKEINLSLQGSEIILDHPLGVLYVPTMGTKDPLLLKTDGRATFHYDFAQKHLKGTVPLSNGRLQSKKTSLTLEDLNASVTIDGSKLKVEKISASCPFTPLGTIEQIKGNLTYDIAGQALSVTDVHGVCLLPGKEDLYFGAHRLEWDKQGIHFDLYAKTKGKEVVRVAGEARPCSNGQMSCSFERGKTHFLHADLSSSRLVLNKDYGLDFIELYTSLDCEHFFHQLRSCDWLSFSGLDAKGNFQVKLIYQAGPGRLAFHAESKNMRWGTLTPAAFSLKGEKEGATWTVEKLQIDQLSGKGIFAVHGDQIDFSQWELLAPQGYMKGKGSYSLSRHQAALQLDSLKVDLAKVAEWTEAVPAKGSLAAQGNMRIDFPYEHQPFFITTELKALADLTSPVALKMKSDGVLKGSYSEAQGVKLERVALVTDEQSQVGFEAFSYHPQNKHWNLQACRFSLSPHFLQMLGEKQILPSALPAQALTGVISAEGHAKEFSLEGQVDDASCSLLGSSWNLKHLVFKGKQGKWVVSGKTLCNQQPLFVQLHLDQDEELLGMLKVQEAPKAQGMTLLFKKPRFGEIAYESLQGSLLGLEAQFTKEGKNRLKGALSFNPLVMAALFPKNIQDAMNELAIGKGYSLAGTLSLGENPQFLGELSGKHFALLGCEFQAMHAQLKVLPHQISLQNLTITDTGGEVAIKQILMQKKGERWSLDIPVIHIRELRPSVMQQRLNPDKPLKPFVIKNLSLLDIRGTLGDLSSFSGKGQLNFSNAAKKESTLLDTPLDIIKDLGLDLSLLTPVYGEIALQLSGDKFYIEALKNMYSEGRRSEFYLASLTEPSYIDLKGNLHLDLNMRQDVLLKIAEQFTLNVRGTLAKPRYSLATTKD